MFTLTETQLALIEKVIDSTVEMEEHTCDDNEEYDCCLLCQAQKAQREIMNVRKDTKTK